MSESYVNNKNCALIWGKTLQLHIGLLRLKHDIMERLVVWADGCFGQICYASPIKHDETFSLFSFFR